ncbi:MAG TPA: thiamine pyrophosphate-dependent dehydrogenase E1 component subunit alpha [Candidatus Andersenbacteria bacterium]|nr:thiamine pyrophosphate-dependent dehydrogenase E1 component subunit alpha [Candidatus Andersenbacteria bacterium]
MPSRSQKLLEGSLYTAMLRIRMVEEKIVELYPEQQMRCPVHLSIGQEGVAAGVCEALDTKDTVMSGHRAHAHYLAKGGNLKKMIAEIYGRETGCCLGRGGSMHLIDLDANFKGSTPIVGGTIPVAVGLAWAAHMKKEKQVSVIFLGEGTTEEGVWHESVTFAVLHKLRVLFVCENNLYSVYTPLNERQPDRPRTGIAKAHGLYVDHGDGNKALEVYEKTQNAVTHIRSGKGPAFIEFDTYRWREHCGPNFDNALGYRSEEEFLAWQKKDPVAQLEKQALKSGSLTQKTIVSIRSQIEQEVTDAFTFAKKSPYPKKGALNPKFSYAS